MEMVDYFVFLKTHLTLNWTFVNMCSVAPHLPVNKQDTYTDFSVVHGNQLLIQDLIMVLPDGDNKLFGHVRLWKLSLPRVPSNKGIKTATKKFNNEIWCSHSGAGEWKLQSFGI